MKRVTDGILKPVVIVWYCLCITIINCDNKLLVKRNLGKSFIEPQIPKDTKLLESPQSLANIQETPNTHLEEVLQHKNENTVKDLASNDTKNIKPEAGDITSNNSNVNNPAKVDPASNNTAISNAPKIPSVSPKALPPINTGALFRGVSVFLGLSIIVIAYIIFRCARLKKNRTQMVRKYGVLAHRQDVEMRPLPLDDEDEDDTTVFDASEIGVRDEQRRSTYQ